MSKFFYKTRGAISVFLVIVLLPVLLFGGMVTDAARIFCSKVVISDAGEMAMNAALAQYNQDLLDEYGLLVMDSDPASYEENIKEFFERSLSAAGLPDEEEYAHLLDLIAEDVHAYAVVGSEIYRSEVERQQIIEYMKYRAPVCLVDMILEKLDVMKDTQKKVEAVESEMEFAEAMKDCQDAMVEAYNALNDLRDINNTFQWRNVQGLLDEAQMGYKKELFPIYIMLQAISKYNEKSSDSLDSMAASFVEEAKKIDLGEPEACFNEYLDCLYYKNGVADKGGIDKLLTQWESEHPEPSPAEEDIPVAERAPGSTETTRETSAHASWSEDKGKIEKKIKDYKEAEKAIEGYSNALRKKAMELTDKYTISIGVAHTDAIFAQASAQTALEKLEAVKKLIETAQGTWEQWNTKEGEAFGNTDGSDKYKNFFSEEDAALYDALVQKVNKVQQYYEALIPLLQKESACGKSLATESSKSQYEACHKRAGEILSGVTVDGTFEVRDYKDSFSYVHADVTGLSWSGYDDDTFYKKLKEYTEGEKEVKEEDSGEKQEANKNLEEGQKAGEEANDDSGYPDFNWDTVENADLVLPSRVQSAYANQANEAMTGVGGNVDDNENALKRFQDSIKAASSFLDGLDRILAEAVEDLYIAEYTMQMLSYYTVDRNLDSTKKETGELITLSGYNLPGNHKAYKAEAEYVLWGNADSRKNVQYVVMTLFGIRLLFNSIFAFTDGTIRSTANAAASAIAAAAPFLIPIVQVLIQLGFAAVETANDITKLKQGYGVTIIKDKNTWATAPYFGDNTNTKKKSITLSYSEYMRIFLVLSMMASGDKNVLARIADCIQVNTDYDLVKGYTMISMDAKVKSRTTFMRKISEMEGGPGTWSYADDFYTIHYQSVLGY